MTKKYIKAIHVNNIITSIFWVITTLLVAAVVLLNVETVIKDYISLESMSLNVSLGIALSIFYTIFFFLNTRTYILAGNIRFKYSGFELSSLIYILSLIILPITIVFFWLVSSRLNTLNTLIARQEKNSDKTIKPLDKTVKPLLEKK